MSTATNTAAATDREKFRVLLEEQRAEALDQRATALAEAAVSLPDPVAISRAAALARTVDEIDAALGRLADGSYGTCVRCGRDIPAERLEFRPSAAGCVACQQPAR
jgi:DnaK suppressor protein